MGIAYRPQRRRPWMAYWRDPQTGRQHSRCFATEDEARQFEAWQKRSVAREADVPKTKPASKVTVQAIIRAYLEHYTSESVTSKKQAEYHARHVVRVLGRRQAMLLDAEALVAFVTCRETSDHSILDDFPTVQVFSILPTKVFWRHVAQA